MPWAIDDQRLGELFTQFGEVLSAKVVKDRETNRSRGFGFVEMANEQEAQEAIKQLDGSDLEGRKLVVNIARPKEESNDRGFDRNRSGGRR